MYASFFSRLRRVFLLPMRLSLRQTGHEWASALCQCIALSAVIMPVLLMLGLKNGLISREWNRLLNDPDILLLAPHFSSPRKEVSFAELREIARLPGVQTVIPRLSTLDSQVFLYSDKVPLDPGESWSQATQLVLTKEGDKTLSYYGCPIPVFNQGEEVQEVVLNHVESERLMAPVGSIVHMTGFRISPDKKESFDIPLRVIGVLPPDNRSSDIANVKKIYVPERIAYAVLDYYAGLPCLLTGEKSAAPPPVCRALLMLPDREITHLHTMMKKSAGFHDRDGVPIPGPFGSVLPPVFPTILLRERGKQIFPVTAMTYTRGGSLLSASQWNRHQADTQNGIPVPRLPDQAYMVIPPPGKGMAYQAYYACRILPELAEGMGPKWKIYPWNPGIKITYVSDRFEQGDVSVPWNDPSLLENLSSLRTPGRCTLYTGPPASRKTSSHSKKESSATTREITIHPAVSGREASHAVVDIVTVPGLHMTPPHYLCAPEDLGILRLSALFPYNWDYRKPSGEAFTPIDRQFGFRCYADSLHHVDVVKKALEDRGFTCASSQADIAKNKTLDANLSRLLLLISALGGGGALIALVLNLFNATERRKKDYAVLRTLGLGRISLLALPVYETTTIMALTLALSFGLYHGLSTLMSRSFADMLPSGAGVLCEIPPSHQLSIVLGALSVAVFSAFCSSLRLCRLSPAAYIRES